MRGQTDRIPIGIVSAERANLPAAENAARTRALRAEATRRGIAFGPCLGMWQGHGESSTLIDASGHAGRAFLRWALAAFNQDAVLYVDRARKARLWNRDGSVKPLGFLQSGPMVPPCDAYTYVPSLQTYYWTER